MRLTRLLAAAAAFSLAGTPAIAAPANPAAKLSLANQGADAAAPAAEPKKARNATYAFVGIGVLAIIVAALAMGNSDSKPASA